MNVPPGFRGPFRTDDTARALYSEGAGIYRVLPAAVAVPRDVDDLVALVRWARETGTAIEINASACFLAMGGDDWRAAYMDYLAVLAEQGATFSLGSDSHAYAGLKQIALSWNAAEQLGLDASRIFRPKCKALNK